MHAHSMFMFSSEQSGGAQPLPRLRSWIIFLMAGNYSNHSNRIKAPTLHCLPIPADNWTNYTGSHKNEYGIMDPMAKSSRACQNAYSTLFGVCNNACMALEKLASKRHILSHEEIQLSVWLDLKLNYHKISTSRKLTFHRSHKV